MVITSDRPPKEMTLLDDRLRNRFEGGMMAHIAPPELETRIAIAKRKASLIGLDQLFRGQDKARSFAAKQSIFRKPGIYGKSLTA